jgi:hypothetical protein
MVCPKTNVRDGLAVIGKECDVLIGQFDFANERARHSD